MDQVSESELLQEAVFRLRNIALFDGGKAFEGEVHIKDHALMRADTFRKTALEGPPTRALLRFNSFKPLGTVQLDPIEGGLRVFGRLWASDGLRAITKPGVSLRLQYKPIKVASGECTEARLFGVALVQENNVTN